VIHVQLIAELTVDAASGNTCCYSSTCEIIFFRAVPPGRLLSEQGCDEPS